MTFFTKEVLKKGIKATMEEYLFALEVNWIEGKPDAEQPKVFDRFLSGLLHPMIHVGYACEFDAPGMLAEGSYQLLIACF